MNNGKTIDKTIDDTFDKLLTLIYFCEPSNHDNMFVKTVPH